MIYYLAVGSEPFENSWPINDAPQPVFRTIEEALAWADVNGYGPGSPLEIWPIEVPDGD